MDNENANDTPTEGQGTMINYGTETPQSNTPPPSPPVYGGESNRKGLVIGAAIVIILALGAVLGFQLISHHAPKPVSTTTTIPATSMFNIKNCTTINKPGTYYLLNSIFTKVQNGSCIEIASNDVKLDGNGNLIHGSGPYAIVPPYSYGIEAKGVSNVTVSNLGISGFSYGIYFDSVDNSIITKVNATNNTMSNFFMFDSYDNILENSSASKSASKEGGIYILGGGGNKISNVASNFNIYYGLVINSTNNTIQYSHFENNPADILCNASVGALGENKFANTSCNTNFYCEFATCKKTNVPINFTSLKLMPGNISSCGELVYAGTYVLSKDINLAKILNISNPLTKTISCITIKGDSISLDCNNHTISGVGSGIVANHEFNVSITNCRLANLSYGIRLSNLIYPKASGISITNVTTGIELDNVTGGTLSKISINNSQRGIVYNATSGVTTANVRVYNNTYGIYFTSGSANLFSNSNITNNFKIDVYCSPTTYNSTTNLFQTTRCGVSDCIWANCRSYVLPQLAKYPISQCMTISHSGNYSLQSNLISNNTCFTITNGNILLNCNNHTITGKGFGYGILAINATNVTLENCKVVNFENGFKAKGVRGLNVQNLIANSTQIGIYASNVANATIGSDVAYIYTVAGFYLKNAKNVNVFSDSAQNGLDNASGFVFINTTQSNIRFDYSKRNPADGFVFVNFRNNSVANNTASTNRLFDYYCSPSSSGLFADSTGANTGVTKNICRWLVVEPLVPVNPPCQAISSASQISLSTDMLYNSGATCYNIYNTNSSTANNTVINCNGHTVLANKGGVFVQVSNSSHVTLENCYLENFTQAVIAKGPNTEIINNTIADSDYAISLYGAGYSRLYNNSIFNSTTGIYAYNSNFTSIKNNLMFVENGMTVRRGSNLQIYNNTVHATQYAAQFFNATSLQLKNNLFNGSIAGIECYGIAENASSASQDFGGNRCSSNINCNWITSPLCG